jgi:hypothetical protein
MNKYLMLSAAALFATTHADASSLLYSFKFGTAEGGSYCDGGNVYGDAGSPVMSWQHTNADCYGAIGYGMGSLAKFNGLKGKYALMSDTSFSQTSGFYFEVLLPNKLKHGVGIWELWAGFSGTSAFEANEGPLVQVDAARGKRNGRSIASNIKQLIAVHKNARARIK